MTAEELASLAGPGSALGRELTAYLGRSGSVYDQPGAFTAFIRGGGNIELYRRLSSELAARYDSLRPSSLLDLGCGDGLAVVPALLVGSLRLRAARHSELSVLPLLLIPVPSVVWVAGSLLLGILYLLIAFIAHLLGHGRMN